MKPGGREDFGTPTGPAPTHPAPLLSADLLSAAALCATVLSAAALLAVPATAAAQEGPTGETRAGSADEPAMAEAPLQFRVGPTVGSLSWEAPAGDGPGGEAGGERIDDGVLWGLDVASVVGRYAGFRLGGAVGPVTVSRGEDEMDATQYLADVSLEGRLALAPLVERGVVPYATVGVGTAVHDPAPDSLVTRSQSTFAWGAGVDVLLLDRIGARAEWRRVQAELQALFDPVDRSGTTRFAGRWFLGAYWLF